MRVRASAASRSPLMTLAEAAIKGKAGSVNLSGIVMAEVIRRACGGLAEGHPLEQLCGGEPPGSLAALERALLFDLVGYGAHLLDDAPELLGPQGAEQARAALIVIQAVARGGDVEALAATLLRSGGERADLLPCLVPEGARSDPGGAARVGRLIIQMNDLVRHVDELNPQSSAEAILSQLDGASPALSPAQIEASAALIEALRRAGEIGEVSTREGVVRQAAALQVVLDQATVVATGRGGSAPAATVQMVEALVDGDLSRAYEGTRALVGQETPFDAALAFAVRVIEDPDEEGLKRALLAAIAPGPWSDEDFIFDIYASLPVLDLEALDFKFNGNLTLGYNWPGFGVRAKGAVFAYDIVSATEAADTTHPEGELEVWLVSGSLGGWRLEGRLQGSVDFYDSTLVPLDNLNTDALVTETSLMLRGQGMASIRYERGLGAFGIWLGGGFQQERYESLRVDVFGDQDLNNSSNTGLLLEGRLRGQIPLFGELLMARLTVDAVHHEITHIILERGGFSQVLLRQTEVTSRAFLDVEAGRFFGFVPAINIGLDLVQRDQGDESVLSTIPVAGVGVRRVAF